MENVKIFALQFQAYLNIYFFWMYFVDAVLLKPRNAGPNEPRKMPYLQTISPKCLSCLQIWQNCLQKTRSKGASLLK